MPCARASVYEAPASRAIPSGAGLCSATGLARLGVGDTQGVAPEMACPGSIGVIKNLEISRIHHKLPRFIMVGYLKSAQLRPCAIQVGNS